MTFLRKEGQYWKIYYYLNGKKKKISTRTPSKALAEQIKIKFINDLAAQKFGLDRAVYSRITLKEFFKEAEHYGQVNKSPNTAIREKYSFDLFLKFTGDDILIRNIDIRKIEEYKSHLLKNHTPAGININLRHLSAAFSLALKYKYISENPFRNIKMVPVPQKQPIFLTRAQAKDLLRSTHGRHIYQYIIIALFTGCRVSEICNLTWANVDLDHGNIKVTGKGDKERTIPIPKILIFYLKSRKKEKGYVVTGSRKRNEVTHQFRKYADLKGLNDFTFHNLRDTYASWLAQAGESIQVIKELLGHSTIQTTMIYAHLSQKNLEDAVKNLDL